MKNKLLTILIITATTVANITYAATAVHLEHKSPTILSSYLPTQSKLKLTAATTDPSKMEEINRTTDFQNTTHVRLQQTYAGHPVWDAQAIIHLPGKTQKKSDLFADMNNDQSSMNGVIYQNLHADLANTRASALTDEQKAKALQVLEQAYIEKTGNTQTAFEKETVQIIVYVDQNQRAHYGYLTSFFFDFASTGAHRPTAIIDAETLTIYRMWDQVKTYEGLPPDAKPILAGGIGGNEKTGEIIYDGAPGHQSALQVSVVKRNIFYKGKLITIPYCFLTNDELTIVDISYDRISMGVCPTLPAHNNLAWLGSTDSNYWLDDSYNGAHSPSLDAFEGATVIKSLYQDWYHVPVLTGTDGKPMKLLMRVHYGRGYDNAFWDGEKMTFGDGGEAFYPLTSLDVSAHEISHGFTEQHSNLDGSLVQDGALHEAFSDMAAQAAQYYVLGRNGWRVGIDIIKNPAKLGCANTNDCALRYMDDPKKDHRSIDNLGDPRLKDKETDPHLAAGVFNKAFYLIATSAGWDTHKAFNVMVQANMHYWTPAVTFPEAACGVMSATKDYKYNTADVAKAFAAVGIDVSKC